jgi:tRNA U54 and U55 pseudouridine synthase Pus10
MRWEVKKVKGQKLGLVTSGGKELSIRFTAHGRNYVIEAGRRETGRNFDLTLGEADIERHIYICVEASMFLFPTADLTENTHRHYEIYSVLLPVCTAATAVAVDFLDAI